MLRNISKEGRMRILGIMNSRNVCKKIIVERIREYMA